LKRCTICWLVLLQRDAYRERPKVSCLYCDDVYHGTHGKTATHVPHKPLFL
jgi:hypothetical protein